MKRTRLLIVAGLLAAAGTVMARPPAEIIAELESITAPTYDAERRGDAEYRAEYSKLMQEYNAEKAALIAELYAEDPGHEKITELMPQRWQLLQRTDSDTVLEETKSILSQPLASDELRTEAAYWHANVICNTTRYSPEEALPAIETFMQMAPEDDRAARLILGVASYGTDDPDLQMKIYKRSLQLFPDSPANKYTHGKIRQVESLGQPFELTFTEATSGEEISLQRDLRGKVVVLDFWATWCGPCIAEMPKMKELYAEYSGRGVEFIGISLDQPR
ncbi:MAG: redoxin domain-containing protein, partial [Phycisphaerales bacterium JB039]